MKGEARIVIRNRDDEELPQETLEVQRLRNENIELRREVQHLRSAVRTAGRILFPYAADRSMKK